MRTPLSMASPAPTIIVIEDETSMRRLLKTILAAQGYLIVEAETGRRGLVEVGTRKPDLVILDLGLPDMDGAQVIKQLREWSQIPIVVLSARDQEQQKVAALDASADDYLTKPFGAAELLARVRVALRHAARVAGSAGESEFSVGPLKVDLLNRKVWVADILPEGGDGVAHFGGDALTEVTFAFHPRDPLEILPLLRLRQGRAVGHQLIASYLDPAMTAVHFLQPLQRDSAVARLVCRLEVILKGLVLLPFWFAFAANTYSAPCSRICTVRVPWIFWVSNDFRRSASATVKK